MGDEYKKDDRKYGSVGGAWQNVRTSKLAADIQKELCEDILDFKFDKDIWVKKLKDVKDKIFELKLEQEHLVITSSLSKPITEYGQPVIDKETGQQKTRKSDGAPMFAPIPCHIEVVKRMIDSGEEVNVGDKISYIVKQVGEPLLDDNGELVLNRAGKPKLSHSRQIACSIKEFEEHGKYEPDYYYESIVSVVVEILKVICPEDMYTTFRPIWNKTDKQIERILKKIEEESENDE